MRVARTIASFLTAMALALAMVLQATPTPAVAVTGYDSAFLFESDWLIVKPGDTGQAAVTFLNVGSVSWQKGGASQVNLATCCPLNSPPTHAAWLVTPLSSTAYATHREDLVAPGGRATYIWNFKVPDNAAAGIYDFPGDLVLASTGEGIHREGYFHRNDNRPAAALAVTPTKTELTPDHVNGTLGANVTLTAKVTGDPATGTTTRQAVVGIEVTFVVDAGANDVGNSDFTRTGTTDANGETKLTYTRSNPGTDTVAAYPTQFPTVRDTSTVQWSVAGVITVDPDTTATLQLTECRTYTLTVRNASTGATRSGVVVDVAVKEDVDAAENKTTVQINGTDTNPSVADDTTRTVQITTASDGKQTFNVCAGLAGTTGRGGPATPIAWLEDPSADASDNDQLDSAEFRDTGGTVNFAAIKPVFTLTPDDEADAAVGGRRIFTIAATDQFGSVFRGEVDIGFIELTDASIDTTTNCVIDWYDNDESLQTSKTDPSDTTDVADLGATEIPTLNSAGKATFAIKSASTTSCVTVVWQDVGADDNARQTDEPQDTGGKTNYKSAVVTSATLTSAKTNPKSSDDPGTDNGTIGEEKYTFSFRDQSGAKISPPENRTVTFNVRNTGSSRFFIVNVDGVAESTAVDPGAIVTRTATVTTGGDTDATIELDSPNATSAEITANATGVSTVTSTKTWVSQLDEPTAAGTATGTVKGIDTTGDWYLVETSVGTYLITYVSADQFKIAGTSTTLDTFESKLSVGDTVKFTDGTPDVHEIVTDVP